MIHELLIPRYKVIADWPNSIYKIGSILIGKDNGLYYNGVNHANFINPENYPHLFRKLEWHEERTPEEMPQYVRDKRTFEVKKVFKHKTYFMLSGESEGEHETEAICSFDEVADNGYEKLFWRYDLCLPATESEYNQYQSSKNK